MYCLKVSKWTVIQINCNWRSNMGYISILITVYYRVFRWAKDYLTSELRFTYSPVPLKYRKAGSLTGFSQNNIKSSICLTFKYHLWHWLLKTYAHKYNATSYTGGSFQTLFIEKLFSNKIFSNLSPTFDFGREIFVDRIFRLCQHCQVHFRKLNMSKKCRHTHQSTCIVCVKQWCQHF